jgi:hypothetical protein
MLHVSHGTLGKATQLHTEYLGPPLGGCHLLCTKLNYFEQTLLKKSHLTLQVTEIAEFPMDIQKIQIPHLENTAKSSHLVTVLLVDV